MPLLRRCHVLRRIGAFINPGRATAAAAVVPPLPGSVQSADLHNEVGCGAAVESREAADRTFRQLCGKLEAAAVDRGVASAAVAAQLLSHGVVGTGLSMVAELDAEGQLRVTDYILLLQALSCPAMWHHHYNGEHDAMATCKLLGDHRGAERAQESLHLFDRLLLSLQREPGSAAADAGNVQPESSESVDAPQVPSVGDVFHLEGSQYQNLIAGWNAVLHVHLTAGYHQCMKVPDQLYDLMFARQPQIQPSLATYVAVLRALGLTNRMEECDAVWGWLESKHSDKLCAAAFNARLQCLLEAERFLDVEELFVRMVHGAGASAEAFDILCHSIWRHAHSSKGTIPASEEKKLVFFPTWAREQGVHVTDLAPINQQRITGAIERWTHRRGLAKTTEWMLDARRREFEMWNEGQRWRHLRDEEVTTSLMEAAVRRMRGDEVKQRMRLEVEVGGGRGVIFPPPILVPTTRYSGDEGVQLTSIGFDQLGVAKHVFGTRGPPPTESAGDDEASQQILEARRSAMRRGGGFGSRGTRAAG